jgi:glycosyl transferase family 25
MSQIRSIDDIKNIVYINLAYRTDRKEHVEKQIVKLGLNDTTQIDRFNAISLENGALGCSMSHLKCLENAKKNNLEHIMIIEDDIEFISSDIFKKQLNGFLESCDVWDVILIAGNNMIPYAPYNEYAIRAFNCQTTTGYIVRNSYYDTLIKNIKDGVQLLMKNPEEKQKYAIDKYWLNLQKQDKWYLIVPLTVVQREDYSDIEKKNTNFKNYMMNYNKAYR